MADLPAMQMLQQWNWLAPVTGNSMRPLSRRFQFRETQRLELRAEAFNLTNSLRMDDPGTSLNSSRFGRVLSAKDPRIMQFVLKYFF